MKTVMARLALIAVACSCGQRSNLSLLSATAVRGLDDHVTVTAVVECSSSGLGDDCKHPDRGPPGDHYCATATWRLGTDGGSIDVEHACDSTTLAAGSVTSSLTLRSAVPISADAAVTITVALDGSDIRPKTLLCP